MDWIFFPSVASFMCIEIEMKPQPASQPTKREPNVIQFDDDKNEEKMARHKKRYQTKTNIKQTFASH